MTETRPRRRWGLRFAGILFLVMAATVVWYFASGGFTNSVRTRIVSRLEQITGGRVELGSLHWNLGDLSIILKDVTIHGTEPQDQPAYVHVDEVLLDPKVGSLFGDTIAIDRLGLKHPEVHLLVYADGSTNQPQPKPESGSDSDPVASIFAMTLGRFEITDGEFFVNGKRAGVDMTAQDIAVQMRFESGRDRYRGNVKLGDMAFRRSGMPPLKGDTKIDFLLQRSKLTVESLLVESPDGKFEGSGEVTDFAHPHFDLTYAGSGSLAALAAALGNQQVRAGRLTVKGTLQGSYEDFRAEGRLLVSNLELREQQVHLSGVNIGSAYRMDHARLAFTQTSAQLLGGGATGSLEIKDWTKTGEQMGQGSFHVSGIQVNRVITALPQAPVPVEDLHFSGSSAGNVQLSWKGSPSQAVASFEIAVTPPQAPPANALPVEAHLQGSYRVGSSTLELRQFKASTPQTQMEASGRLSARDTQLKIAASGTSSSELQPLFASGPLSHLPLHPYGPYSFRGTISGRLKTPVLEGALELGDFTTRLSLVQNAAVRPPELHWDHFAGQVHYSPDAVWVRSGVLQRGPATAKLAVRAELKNGNLEPGSAVEAEVSTQHADLADLQTAFGAQYPISGEVNAQATISGTRENLLGQGRLEVSNGTIKGEPFQSLNATFALNGQQVRASDVLLRKNGGNISGEGSFNLTTEEFRFKVAGRQIHLASLQTLQRPKLKVDGLLSFQAEGSGTAERPVLNAKLTASGLQVNEQVIGGLEADLTTVRREMTVKVRSDLSGGDIKADGKVQLSGTFPLEMRAQFENVNLTPLAQMYAHRQLPGTALVWGEGQLSGPLRTPRLLNANITVEKFKGTMEPITIQNDGPWQFAYQDQAIRIAQFHVTGEGTDLTASGGVDLKGDTSLDLRANGRANLQLLRDTIPGMRSYGAATMELAVSGTVSRPNLSGQIKVNDAGINFIDLPNGLSDVNGTLVFNENRLRIQQLRARTGGGEIDLTGFVAYRNGIYFELGAQGEDIRFRYPDGISSNANANLKLTGTLKNALLSGDVTVTRFTVTPKFDLALYLASSRQATPTPLGNSMLDNIKLDVHVTTTPELHVETSLAKLSAEADVHLRGSLARPVVLGRVNIVEGDIFFNGTKYHLERGDISFSNPVRTEPVLNVEASARVRSYDITIGFHGSVNKLGTTYRSEPPLPTGDIIALLALGHTRDETDIAQQQSTSFTETASNAILGQALNYAVSNRVQKLFGVSRIKIDPMVGGPDNAGARVTIEQQVNNNVTLTYITNLAQSSQQVIQAEFTYNRNLSFVVVRDEFGVLGFDVRIRQRLK